MITIKVWVVLLILSFGSPQMQIRRYDLIPEEQAQAPVKIREGHITLMSDGRYEFNLVVENTGKVDVSKFGVLIANGLLGFDIELRAGERKVLSLTYPKGEFDRLMKSSSQENAQGVPISITKVQWDEKAGVPIPINVGSLVDSELALRVVISNKALSFPQEPASDAFTTNGQKILTYAKTSMTVSNLSPSPVKEVHYEVQGLTSGEWRSLSNITVTFGKPAAPGEKLVVEVRLPLEIMKADGTEKPEQYRIHIREVR